METQDYCRKGRFIVFEGIDGSGKSTQIQIIEKRLKDLKIEVFTTFEPTDGPVGTLIRQMLSGAVKTDQKTLALLFAADRTDHLVNHEYGILDRVEKGEMALCDRYYFSSYAYHAQHMDMDWVIHANLLNANLLRPDLTIFIDADPDTCFERIKKNRNRFEMFEKLDVMKKVRENYFRAFERLRHVENIALINGNASSDQVSEAVLTEIIKIIPLA